MKKGSTFHTPIRVVKMKGENPTVVEILGRKYTLVHEDTYRRGKKVGVSDGKSEG